MSVAKKKPEARMAMKLTMKASVQARPTPSAPDRQGKPL